MPAPQIAVNPNPGATYLPPAGDSQAGLVPVPVTLSGRVKCAPLNTTVTGARLTYSTLNPLWGPQGHFNRTVMAWAADGQTVLTCAGRFGGWLGRKAHCTCNQKCSATHRHTCIVFLFPLFADTLDGTCFDNFAFSNQQTQDFAGAAGRVYKYTRNVGSLGLVGSLGYAPALGYGSGGYLVQLTNDKNYAAQQLIQV